MNWHSRVRLGSCIALLGVWFECELLSFGTADVSCRSDMHGKGSLVALPSALHLVPSIPALFLNQTYIKVKRLENQAHLPSILDIDVVGSVPKVALLQPTRHGVGGSAFAHCQRNSKVRRFFCGPRERGVRCQGTILFPKSAASSPE